MRVPGLPHPIELRAGTSDASVLRQILLDEELAFELRDDPKLIIDAGANIGTSSIYLAMRYPRTDRVALELDGGNYWFLYGATWRITPASFPCTKDFGRIGHVWQSPTLGQAAGRSRQSRRTTPPTGSRGSRCTTSSRNTAAPSTSSRWTSREARPRSSRTAAVPGSTRSGRSRSNYTTASGQAAEQHRPGDRQGRLRGEPPRRVHDPDRAIVTLERGGRVCRNVESIVQSRESEDRAGVRRSRNTIRRSQANRGPIGVDHAPLHR